MSMQATNGQSATQRERDELRALLRLKEGEIKRLVAEVEQLRAELADASRQLVAADAESGQLLRLHVALTRLVESADREAALEALKDVVINIVGSEDFAVYESGAVVATMGETAARHARFDGELPLVRDAIASGRPRLAAIERESRQAGPVACVPLMLGREVKALLVVFQLLPHKPALGTRDLDVLELLRAHAATALLAAELRSRALRGDR